MTFSGIPIYVCEHLPKTKTIRWRTERKWCHWKNAPARRYSAHSKEVPCNTMVMLGGRAFMSSSAILKIQDQLGKGAQ